MLGKRVLFLVVGLFAMACSAPQGPAQAPSSGADATPKRGGILRLPQNVDYVDYDSSHSGQSTPNGNAIMLVYETLLKYKNGPELAWDEMVLQPRLAERWEISPDARSFTFYLRKGVKYPSAPPTNGREFTSADVKWNYEYYSRSGPYSNIPRGNYAWTTDGLDRVDTPDPYIVTMRFKEPYATWPTYAATRNFAILTKEIYDQDGHLKNRLLGPGPFYMDTAASQKGTRYVFKRNPEYYQKDKPYLDELHYFIINSEQTRHAAFTAGQIDLDTSDSAQAGDIEKNNADAVHYKYLVAGQSEIYPSVSHPPFNDLRVRQAMSYAIDRDAYIKTITRGEGQWALSGTWSSHWTQEEIKSIVKYDTARSKQLLKEAGYENVKVKILNRSAEAGIPTDQVLFQAQLNAAGFDASFESVDKAIGSQRLYKGDFDVFPTGPQTFGDVDTFLYGNNHSTSVGNWIQVKDSKLDELIVAQRATADPALRRERIRAATRYIAEQAYTVPLYRGVTHVFWKPYMKGYTPHLAVDNEGMHAADIWLDK